MLIKAVRFLFRSVGLDIARYVRRPGKLDFLRQYSIKTILDIGANIGQSAKEFRTMMPKAQIYSFEPLAECFQKLTETMHGDRHFKAFQFALGDANTHLEMHKSSYDPSSSLIEMVKLHKETFPSSAGLGDERVEVRRLDDVVQELTLTPEILIKMDAQGFESNVIEGGVATTQKARVVILENSFYELYLGQALFDDIYEKMRVLGFSYRGAMDQKYHPKTGDVLFEDSIFVRE